jgi:hypothetical protein
MVPKGQDKRRSKKRYLQLLPRPYTRGAPDGGDTRESYVVDTGRQSDRGTTEEAMGVIPEVSAISEKVVYVRELRNWVEFRHENISLMEITSEDWPQSWV